MWFSVLETRKLKIQVLAEDPGGHANEFLRPL
jgi:hypothetical protein